MNDLPEREPDVEPIAASARPSSLFSVVWLIPLLALVVGGWMLWDNLRSRGPEITLYMDSAEGIEVDKTVIKVLSVNVGRVTAVHLKPDQTGVEITAKLDHSAADLLRKDTHFWVVKPRIDQGGITGLGTLVSGVYLEFSPGRSAEKANTFTVDSLPPVTSSQQNGLRLRLVGDSNRLLGIGTPVLYHDITVGRVERAEFNPADKKIHYQIFIDSPNDKLIGSNVYFWTISGVDIQTNAQGIKLRTGPISTLINGAITFSEPLDTDKGSQVAQNSEFPLHNDSSQIEDKPSPRALYYVAYFDQSIRGLTVGAPVEYKGVPIGSVSKVPYFAAGDSVNLLETRLVPVLFRIEPARMERDSAALSKQQWQDKIRKAIDKGLVATLTSNSLLTGTLLIQLTDEASATASIAPRTEYAGYPVVPTRAVGLDSLQKELNNLLIKFNQLPLEKTVTELNSTLGELQKTVKSVNKIAADPHTRAIPQELNRTLRDLQTTLQGVSPQSPAYREVQTTLNSLNQTLKQIQPLTRTLNEQPNALIFNANTQDPTPKGVR